MGLPGVVDANRRVSISAEPPRPVGTWLAADLPTREAAAIPMSRAGEVRQIAGARE